MIPDNELLRQYAEQGDEAAFTEVVRRHVDWVYSAALRLVAGDAHLAQDVVQVVITDFARKAAKLSRYDAPGGWLHTATRYAASKAIDREQRRRRREQEAYAMQTPTTTPEICWEQLRPALDEAIGQLPEADRNAVVMRFFEGKSHREIGDLASLTEDSARKRVERAVEKLRTNFARRGITVSSGLLVEVISVNSVQAAPAGLAEIMTNVALKSAVAGGISSPFLYAIFSMTTKTKLTVFAAVFIMAVIPTYYFLTPSGDSSPDQSTPKNESPTSVEAPTAKSIRLGATSASALNGQTTSVVTPVADAASSTAVKIAPPKGKVLIQAPDPEALDALKTGLIDFKRSEDLDKLDPVGRNELKAWAMSNPQAIVDWLGDVPEDNKSHEHALEGMISLVIDDNPRTALFLAKAINDPIVRDSRTETALMALALQDPTAAANALDSSDLSNEDNLRTNMSALIEKIRTGEITDEQRAKILDEMHR